MNSTTYRNHVIVGYENHRQRDAAKRAIDQSDGNSRWIIGNGTLIVGDEAARSIQGAIMTADYRDPARKERLPIFRLGRQRDDLLLALKAAIRRVEIANAEGDPSLSAWLPDARAAIARAE